MSSPRGGDAKLERLCYHLAALSSWRLPSCVALAFGAAACAASPGERAAERGDLAALHLVIAAREKTGDLSDRDAARLALAVAEHEVRTASGPEAVNRVREARSCAHELDSALSKRMLIRDAAGAEAALARIEGGGLRAEDARAFAGADDPPWRAVSARSLVRVEDRDERLRALLDPDPRVRREAARAARDARDPADLAPLAEAARVDPAPIVQTEAVRALAVLPAASNGVVVDILRDLWKSGDDGLREDIALAWTTQPLWGAGGRDALRFVVATGHGPAVVEAAAAVLRLRDADGEVSDAAVGLMERAIESGPLATRLQALAQAALARPELLAAVQRAGQSDDWAVRVAALARLGENKDARVVEELESLARPGSPVAARARFALAFSGDRRVQEWVEQDLGADRPEVRLAAMTELAAMGRAGRSAPLLADGDAAVRLRAACTMIAAARRR
jgi:HEAT repeat protein